MIEVSNHVPSEYLFRRDSSLLVITLFVNQPLSCLLDRLLNSWDWETFINAISVG